MTSLDIMQLRAIIRRDLRSPTSRANLIETEVIVVVVSSKVSMVTGVKD